jgi:glycosyltransferase involved in cell wall biosynthesis
MNNKKRSIKKPKISIITTVKGRWKYLKQSIPTILAQSYKNFEYIIVDYNCPQHSGDKVKKLFKDKRLRTVKVPVKKNEWDFNRSRNQGFLKSRGEYILIIDSDAILGKDFLSHCLKNIRKDSFICGWKQGWDPRKIGPEGYSNILFIQRRYFEEFKGYNEELGKNWGYDDIDIFVRLQEKYKMLLPDLPIRTIQNTAKEKDRYNRLKGLDLLKDSGPGNMVIAEERFRGFDGKLIYYKDIGYKYPFPKYIKEWLVKWKKKNQNKNRDSILVKIRRLFFK